MDPRWNRAANAVEAALLRFRGAVINASTACRCGHDGKANFNPAQPRDEFGRWTDGGSGWSDSHRPPRHEIGLPADCMEEIDAAALACAKFLTWAHDMTPGLRGRGFRSCMQGQISERCGGSAVVRRRGQLLVVSSKDSDMPPSLPLSVVPELDRALKNLGTLQDLAYAQAACDNYCQRNPDEPEGFDARRYLHMRAGRLTAALADANEVIRLRKPPHPGDFMGRADILAKLGRWREAIADFHRVNEFDPTGWFEAYPALRRAECHLMLGDLAAAEAECDRIADDYTFPGFMGKLAGSKFDVLDRIAAIRSGR